MSMSTKTRAHVVVLGTFGGIGLGPVCIHRCEAREYSSPSQEYRC